MITRIPDPRIRFFREALGRVPYLANMDDSCFFDIMFAMRPKSFEKDQVVLSTDQSSENLYIINEGVLEVSTSFE